MSRKLVTVRQVGAVKAIKGADKIELAIVDGWNCIVKKGQFDEGGLGVFFEIDSFLPATDPRWAFLEKNFIDWNHRTGFRVKSMKMKGQISQGLLDSLDTFPEITTVLRDLEGKHGKQEAEALIRAMSFEDVLNVVKWEVVHNTAEWTNKTVTIPFPFFINRTDQERVQNLPNVFDDWRDGIFQETTKMDGSSMTAYFLRQGSEKIGLLPELDAETKRIALLPNGRFGVCSRNTNLRESDANGRWFWEVTKKYNLPAKLSELNRNIALQGELCGSSVQSNFEGFPQGVHDFFLFSIWDIDEQKYIKPKEAEAMARQLGIKHVPVTGYFRLGDIATTVDGLLARAEGEGLYGKKREGIVLKEIGGEFSFKAISNTYLLKHGE
ncbi:hypothetical protein AB5N19_05498 [Seiridium cardinale]|uniref:RNA ligase domain-containing protein n=1 Tax=Seiridium cardinale TaxID=138064 RepID=A0ABR2XIK9_9PEZI